MCGIRSPKRGGGRNERRVRRRGGRVGMAGGFRRGRGNRRRRRRRRERRRRGRGGGKTD